MAATLYPRAGAGASRRVQLARDYGVSSRNGKNRTLSFEQGQWPQSRGGGHRLMQYRLSGASGAELESGWAIGIRYSVDAPVATGRGKFRALRPFGGA